MACGIAAAGILSFQAGFVSHAEPGIINDTGVRIRSSADTSSNDNVITSAGANMEVEVISQVTGSDGNTWYEIEFLDGGETRTGYIRQDYVTLDGEGDTAATTEEPQTGGTDQEAPTENENNNPEGLAPIEGLNEDLTCYVGETRYYINQGFADDQIPSGFSRTTVDYRGSEIQVAKSNDIELYAAYLTMSEDTSQSDWFVYDAELQGFCNLIRLETMQGKYVYFLDTFGTAQMDFGYEETELEIDGKTVPAWQLILSAEEDLSGENDSFYYVYGINQDGNKGLYSYYTKDGTYQRNVLTGLEIVDDEYLSTEENIQLLQSQLKELQSSYTDGMSQRFTIICVLIVVCVLLLFVSIHMGLKARTLRMAGEEDDQEEPAEKEPRFRKNGRLMLGFGKRDQTDSDDEDEEDYEEDDQEYDGEDEDDEYGDEDEYEEEDDEEYGEEDEYEDEEDEYGDDAESVKDSKIDEADEPGPADAEAETEEDEEEEEFDIDSIQIEDISLDDFMQESAAHSSDAMLIGGEHKTAGEVSLHSDDEDEFDADEDEYEDEEDYEDGDEYEDEEDYEDEDEYEDEEDDEEERAPKKRGFFFFGRKKKKEEEYDEYDDEEDEYEDGEYDEDDIEYEDEYEDGDEEDYEEDGEDEDYEDDDEYDEEDYEEEKPRGWFASRRAKKSDRNSRSRREEDDEDYQSQRMRRKSQAADYAEKTVTARKASNSRNRVPNTGQDDDFDFEFIDLDDDF